MKFSAKPNLLRLNWVTLLFALAWLAVGCQSMAQESGQKTNDPLQFDVPVSDEDLIEFFTEPRYAVIDLIRDDAAERFSQVVNQENYRSVIERLERLSKHSVVAKNALAVVLMESRNFFTQDLMTEINELSTEEKKKLGHKLMGRMWARYEKMYLLTDSLADGGRREAQLNRLFMTQVFMQIRDGLPLKLREHPILITMTKIAKKQRPKSLQEFEELKKAGYWPALVVKVNALGEKGYGHREVFPVLERLTTAKGIDAQAKTLASRCLWIRDRDKNPKKVSPQIKILATEAAHAGSTEAIIHLTLYYDKIGDEKRAIQYLKQAAGAGVKECLYDLAHYYFKQAVAMKDDSQREKRDENYRLAYEYFKEAANKNNIEAFWWMGHLKEKGLGVDRDLVVAWNAYSMGAKLGDPEAMVEVGYWYADGKSAAGVNHFAYTDRNRSSVKWLINRDLDQASLFFNRAIKAFQLRGNKDRIANVEEIIALTKRDMEIESTYARMRRQMIIDRDVNEAMRQRFWSP